MDGQNRANAAQMAARNIKSAKPRSGRRVGGNVVNKLDAVPQFAPIPGQQTVTTGGIFGGSMQGGATFDFAAPAGGPTFPPSQSFGSPSPDVSDGEGLDGRWAGDNRATKRQFGGSSTMPANNSFPPFGQSAGNHFSANRPQQAPATNQFSFGSSQPQASSAPNFGASASANTPFTFGASTQPTPPSPAVSFSAGPSNSFSFGQTNQNQGSSNFGQSTQQERPASSSFQFGQTASSTGGIFNSVPASSAPSMTSFGATPTSSAPTTNFFGATPTTSAPTHFFGATPTTSAPTNFFGATPTTSAPMNFFGTTPATSAPTTFFGSTPTTTSPPDSFMEGSAPMESSSIAAPSSIFNRFQPTSAAPSSPSTNFNFGSTTTPSANASTPFQFGASAPAPNPNPPVAIQTPSFNIFGAAKRAETPQSTNMFAAPTSQAPTSSLFSNLNTTAPTNNLFGQPKEKAAPASNLFGGSNGQSSPQPTSNMFNPSSQPTSTPNIFAEKGNERGSTNMFAPKAQVPVTSNLFGSQKPEATTSNIFGNLNSPAPSTMFNNQSSQPAAPTNNLFGTPIKEANSASDLFGNLNKPVDSSFNLPKTNGTDNGAGTNSAQSNLFQPLPPPTPVMQPKPLFPAPVSPEQESSGTNGVSNSPFSFGAVQSPATKSTSTPLKAVDAPRTASQPPSSGLFPSLSQPTRSLQSSIDASGIPPNKILPVDDIISTLASTRATSDAAIRAKIPDNFGDQDASRFLATFRITALNRAMQNVWAIIGMRDPTAAFEYYNEERTLILDHYNVVLTDLKRKPIDHEENSPSKRLRQDGPVLPEPANKRKVTDDEGLDESASKRNRVEPPVSTSNDVSQLSETPPSIASPAAMWLPYPMNGASSSVASPEKSSSFAINGASSAVVPATPALSVTSPAKSKRKATEELTQKTDQSSPLRREMKTPKLNGFTSTPRSGSQTSNIFKNILESPSQSTTASPKKIASPTKSAEASHLNPFGGLAMPNSTATPADDAPRPNPFSSLAVPKSPANGLTSTPAPVASPSVAPVSSDLCGSNPSSVASSDSTAPKAQPFKMPTFGGAASGGVNFMAQFGAQAKKSEEDAEAKKLQAAIDEDYDSDDDLAEFKANWHKKRAEEKKELAEIAKNGQGFKFGPVKPKVDESSSTPKKSAFQVMSNKPDSTVPKPMFGLNTSSQGSGNSVFSSLNSSRAPTPGGSVLNGSAPGKVASFGNNIFGHLSDVDSGKDADDDEDNADGESGDEDAEKKDPEYKPQAETGSDTPPEKTGVGIASTKKSNPFGLASNLGTSSGTSSSTGGLFGRISKDSGKNGDESPEQTDNGGTSTPGGSLFDRISKDSNGKPMRHISTEEKENTQPSSRNIFGDVKNPFGSSTNKTTAPHDNTWKTNSPIKFAPSSDAPGIDITAATPIKSGSASNPFSGFGTTPATAPPTSTLFGSKTDAKPFSNLFGTSSTSKAAPANFGFTFGGANTSSPLLGVSAAPSATTSRATTPGVTTDGESGAEVDPDAERHEQINLTAGGPGEENENVVYEVRAKAQKFVTEGDSKGSWAVKGMGPLRILKHKDTQASRILMRQDPTGAIVVNKSILGGIKYKSSAKTVKVITAADSGEGMETFVLQVKTAEMATELASMLEANKAS